MDYSRLSQEGVHRLLITVDSPILFLYLDFSRNVRFYRYKALAFLFSIFRTPPKAVINNTKKIKKNNTEIEKLKSENGDLQKPLEANKRLTKQTLEFLKKISELPSPDNPHDIKIRKTQNEKIGRGFKEAKTAFEQLDVNLR